ncbi:hypothetical protein PpBr36_07951 [Pyricularia pennisetigena]|uniref:hypothetical protein n=1 Tax=Pyricularia pennisetigena TaxID=1578925 RepID=UPI00114E0024|nr:hypothetical protein PpBr36_07951 [Pyricularia pennisetigena]TLS25115.1 hypothetical protein PpBr36_07951 [Pyricularia pennisetigena]
MARSRSDGSIEARPSSEAHFGYGHVQASSDEPKLGAHLGHDSETLAASGKQTNIQATGRAGCRGDRQALSRTRPPIRRSGGVILPGACPDCEISTTQERRPPRTNSPGPWEPGSTVVCMTQAGAWLVGFVYKLSSKVSEH